MEDRINEFYKSKLYKEYEDAIDEEESYTINKTVHKENYMFEDMIYTETMKDSGYFVSILLYSVLKQDRDLWENRNHYYDIRISFNDKDDNFIDIYESIYTKREAFQLFKIAKLDANDFYLEELEIEAINKELNNDTRSKKKKDN